MNVRASHHAIVRVGQRPGRRGPAGNPQQTLAETLATGKARSRPRRWMRAVPAQPGTRFVYSANHPDVCVVVRDGVAVTAFNRQMFEHSTAEAHKSGRKPKPKPPSIDEGICDWMDGC